MMLERRVVEFAGSFINKLGWDNTFAQWKRLAPTVMSFRLGARKSWAGKTLSRNGGVWHQE